jgi:ankyrin repeat protein
MNLRSLFSRLCHSPIARSAAVTLLALVTLAAHPSITPDTLIWRITDKTDRTTYLTQSFQAHWKLKSGVLGPFGEGTTTVELKSKLKQMPQSRAVTHVDSADPWSLKGTGPLGSPVIITVPGYDLATFHDIESGQVRTVREFYADAIRAGDVPGLSLKRAANSHEIHDLARDGNLAMVRALLKDSPSLVSSRNSLGDTPLHSAVASGQKEMAELLLANRAEVNAKNIYGSTPLHYAADYDHKDVAELLLANKADVNAEDDNGNTPLDVAVAKGHKDMVELLPPPQNGGQDRSTQSAANLKGPGSQYLPTGPSEIQMPASQIHSAARQGNLGKVKLLLGDHPALVSSKDSLGDTPLHSAAEGGHKDVAELLLANKSEVNAKNNYGSTPLHYAADYDHKDVAELLLANGAEVNVKNNDGETPLHEAAEKGYTDLAELLRQHGGHE